MSFLIATAHAEPAAATASATGSPIATLLWFVIPFAFMYFFLIRPQNKRAKEHRQMIDSIAAGNEVVFANGLMGRISRIEGDYAVIELGKGMEVKVLRASITAILPPNTLAQL